MIGKKKKVVFITNVPAPYRVAMLNVSGEKLEKLEIRLKVLFLARGYQLRNYWEGSLQSARFEYHISDDFHFQWGSEKLINSGWSIPRNLRRETPDLVISAGFSFSSVLALRYAKKFGIPFLIHSGETMHQAEKRRLKFLRNPLRRYLISHSTAFIAYGTEAKEYLRRFGIQENNIFISINSVDTRDFQKALQDLPRKTPAARSQPRMLYVGNLQRQKGLEFALRALQIVQSEYQIPVQFDIVGDGPDRERLMAITQSLDLQGVIFWGAKRPNEVIPFYAETDFFVFPSMYDIFGLVMVEAAAAGLPIIASRYAGGTVDIVEHDKNGYIIDPTRIEDFAGGIKKLSENPSQRKEFGRYSLEKIKGQVNILKSAEGFVNAISSSLEE